MEGGVQRRGATAETVLPRKSHIEPQRARDGCTYVCATGASDAVVLKQYPGTGIPGYPYNLRQIVRERNLRTRFKTPISSHATETPVPRLSPP
eukprot:1196588-Rhodomonas_salina.7